MSTDNFSRLKVNGWEQGSLESLLKISIGGIWGEENGISEVNVDVVRVTELKAHGVIEPSTAAKRSITKKQLISRALEVGDLLLEKSGGGPNTFCQSTNQRSVRILCSSCGQIQSKCCRFTSIYS
jgi:hypothetical protein